MLRDAGIPIVLLDRDIVPHPRRSRFDVVSIAHRRAAHMLVADLLELLEPLRLIDPQTPELLVPAVVPHGAVIMIRAGGELYAVVQ